MKRLILIQKITIIVLLVVIISIGVVYRYNISPVSKTSKEVEFIVSKNETLFSIAGRLEKNNLIKSDLFYKVYIKLFNKNNLQVGTYTLNQNMSLEEIIDKFAAGTLSGQFTNIIIYEGDNMNDFIDMITSKTDITKQQILDLLTDDIYLNKLIDTYWFLTEDILNNKLFYSLEGYLYPNTYQIDTKWDIENIFSILLDEFEKKIEPYKNEIENSNYSINELITLASIVEIESSSEKYNADIAQVFYNRLNNNMNLGSDVTTYYDIQVDLDKRDLTDTDLLSNNGYNTRLSSMAGKLPVGPICSPSIASIKAVVEPNDNNYLYFLSDKDGVVYFNETYAKHLETKAKLISEDKWFQY